MIQVPLYTEVIGSLRGAGYSILEMDPYEPRNSSKSCFDIAARKKLLLMIKIFLNIDKIPPILIENLKLISYFFNGTPLIIGNKTRKTALRDKVVYERRGIPAVNLDTFKHFLKDEKLFIISRKGGFYVRVDGDKIRSFRLKEDLSLQEVATRIGVTRKAVYLFEKMEMIKAENIHQLEDIFAESFKFPIDLSNWEISKEEFQRPTEETEFQSEIKEILEDLGFNIYWAKKAPFDGITFKIEETNQKTEESCLITGLSTTHRRKVYDRIKMIGNISRFAHKLSMFIIEEGKLPVFDNVLILQKQILEKMKDIQELSKMLKKVRKIYY